MHNTISASNGEPCFPLWEHGFFCIGTHGKNAMSAWRMVEAGRAPFEREAPIYILPQ